MCGSVTANLFSMYVQPHNVEPAVHLDGLDDNFPLGIIDRCGTFTQLQTLKLNNT